MSNYQVVNSLYTPKKFHIRSDIYVKKGPIEDVIIELERAWNLLKEEGCENVEVWGADDGMGLIVTSLKPVDA